MEITTQPPEVFFKKRCSEKFWAQGSVSSQSLLVTRYKFTSGSLLFANSLVTDYLLQTHLLPVTRCKFIRCLLLVVKSLVARCSLQIHSLLITNCKFTHCSLPFANSLVACSLSMKFSCLRQESYIILNKTLWLKDVKFSSKLK